jgi:hypothetical protein
MKAKRLIELLIKIVEEHGDLEVCCEDAPGDFIRVAKPRLEEIDEVTFDGSTRNGRHHHTRKVTFIAV